MKKLELKVPETEQIEINGEVFDILKTDIDILNKSVEFQDRAKEIIEKKNAKLATETVIEMVAFFDEILGKGAAAKIAKGHPIGLKHITEWLTALCSAINESSVEYLSDKYE